MDGRANAQGKMDENSNGRQFEWMTVERMTVRMIV